MSIFFDSKLVEWLIDITLDKDWKLGTPLPVPLAEAASVMVNGQLYLFGGFTNRLLATNKVYVYDSQAQNWVQISETPYLITHINTVADGPYVWIAGGFVGHHPGAATDRVFRFNTEDYTWTEFPPLPKKRASGALQLFNGQLHYYGGFHGSQYPRDTTCDDHWSLDLAHPDQWIERAPMPEPKGHHSSVVFEDRLYAIGGQIRHDTKPEDLDSVYAYNPAVDAWEVKPQLPEPRSHFESSTFVYRNNIVIIGGRGNQEFRLVNKPLLKINQKPVYDSLLYQLGLFLAFRKKRTPLVPSVTVYNPRLRAWKEMDTLPFYLLAPVANVVNQKLMVTGGGRKMARLPQCRTMFNETLLEAIGQLEAEGVATPSR